MLRSFAAISVTLACLAAVAQEPKKQPKKAPERVAISDPAQLKDDADFAAQGEYRQVSKDGTQVTSVQLIALGGGKFRVRTIAGGLPGTAPEPTDVAELEGALGANFQPGPESKLTRTSPTAGAKPPAGADVLFAKAGDEKNWAGGKLVTLSDGEFLGASNCKSEKHYTDFTAHVEFRLPFMPNSRGQGRANSGFYLQDRYEVQVLDSFGLKGENNECGGVYTLAKPSVNMCFPPMSWQTYDIDFTAAKFDAAGKKSANARLTLKHNGVTVHDNVELKNATGGGQAESAAPGPFQLQNHGDPVVYRNIWAVAR